MVLTDDVAKSAGGNVLGCIPHFPPMLALRTAPPLSGGAPACHYSLTRLTRPPRCTWKAPTPNCLYPLTSSLFSYTSFSLRPSPSHPTPSRPPFLWTFQQVWPFSWSRETLGILGVPQWNTNILFTSDCISWTSEMIIVVLCILPLPDNQAENRQQPFCQRISRLLQAYWHWEVMRIFCLLSLSR